MQQAFGNRRIRSMDLLFCLCMMFAVPLSGCLSKHRVQQPGLFPFEQDNLWGYKNDKGEVVIPPRYEVAQPFSPEGIAAVADGSGWAYINPKGGVVIKPLVVDNGPDYFSEGLARYTEGGKFGFFDQSGKVIIPPSFDFVLPFADGMAAFCEGCREEVQGEHRIMKSGRWGFLDKKGDVRIPPLFDGIENFRNGKARVKMEGQWKHIDRNGNFVESEPIGVARMENDGTIVLQLRAVSSGGTTGDGFLKYPKGHPEYEKILRHIGGLETGQSKPVPPWPDK
jgi:hypothetical protein